MIEFYKYAGENFVDFIGVTSVLTIALQCIVASVNWRFEK